MLKRTLLLVLSLGAGAVVVTALHAQQPGAAAATRPALSALDYLEIQQLAARYAYALDSGADGGRMYASLFTPDGTFVQRGGGSSATGRDKLAAMALQFQKGPMVVNHFIVNHIIEPAADGAIGKLYLGLLDIGENGKPSKVGGAGHYEDTYAKTAEGWRFKRREYIPSQTGLQPSYTGALLKVTPRVATAAPRPGVLTPEDYVEIQQLVSRYPYGLDTGADTGYMYADVFTPDATFTSGGRTHTGRDALKALAWEHKTGQGPSYVRNFTSNVRIEPSPEGAVGRVFQVVIDIDDTKARLLNGGHYEDQYVRTPEGWRIKSRQYKPDADGPAPAKLPMPDVTVHTVPVPLVRPHPAKAMTLTAQDYVDIQQLAAAYSHALDTGAGNGYAYADLFIPDGTAFDRWIGRDKIAEIPQWNPHGPNYVRHFAMNHLIEPTADGAIGRQYVVVIDVQREGKPTSIFLGGQYQDVYVKTPKGWRFKSRTEFRSGSKPTEPRDPR